MIVVKWVQYTILAPYYNIYFQKSLHLFINNYNKQTSPLPKGKGHETVEAYFFIKP